MNTKYYKLYYKEKDEKEDEEITTSLAITDKNNSINKQQTFIFSINDCNKATLIDISNLRNNDLNLLGEPEQIKLQSISILLLSNSHNSMVAAGDNIYIVRPFLDRHPQTLFGKFSIKTKSFKYPVEMKGLGRGEITLTACYDGQDYIYFYNYIHSFSVKLFIERFNIRTQTTDFYHKISKKQVPRNHLSFKILSFIYNGIHYSLGSVRDSYLSLSTFNLQSKSFDIYTIKELYDETSCLRRIFFPTPKLACTDNRGNIYIYHKMNRFVRFNVDSKELVELSTISFEKSFPLRIGITLLYHEVSENDSYIFLMGGKALGNFVYSTSSEQWTKFYEGDECDRLRYGSAIVSLNLK